MRKFVAVFFMVIVAGMSWAIYKYATRYGSIEGQIVFTSNEGLKYYTDFPVYLIRGKVEENINGLDKEYILTAGQLEKRFAELKQLYDRKKEEYQAPKDHPNVLVSLVQ